ncbi:hypothetical protein K7432_007261 [Basidiobolus ranarum]|uniref:Uncharacterized protein n=1 Tax=Basidiobolus ranarum TaxID=34480 RepID=A0ABR2W0D9_9FUNG
MKLFCLLLILVSFIYSAIASPFPLGVNVNVSDEPTTSTPASDNSCNDAEIKIKALGLNISTVVCLSENDPVASNLSPNTYQRCPTVDTKVRALGLDIRAVVCLEDNIYIFVNI